MRKILILFLVILWFSGVYGQFVVLEEHPKNYKKLFEKKNFSGWNFTYSFGSFIPVNDFYKITPVLSNSQTYSLIFRKDLAKFFAVGFEASLIFNKMTFSEDFIFIKPDSIKMDYSEKISYWGINSGIFTRIFLSKHGLLSGNYLDFGIKGSYFFSKRYILKIRQVSPLALPSDEKKIIYKNFRFLYNYEGVAFMRIGFNKIAFFAEYRLNSLIIPYIAGIDEGFYYDFPRKKITPYSFGFQFLIF